MTPEQHPMDILWTPYSETFASSVNGSKFDGNGTTGSHMSRRSTSKLLLFCKVKLWQVLRLCSKLYNIYDRWNGISEPRLYQRQ